MEIEKIDLAIVVPPNSTDVEHASKSSKLSSANSCSDDPKNSIN
jgi:hypothetical protein